jgi:hypothetical protein
MPEFPAIGGSYSETAGAVTASSIGTTVANDAGSSSTKGTIVQLIAATAHDAHWISVSILTAGTPGTVGLCHILIGASTESVLIADLPCNNRAANEGGGGPYLFPLFIPKGSRLSAQYQANNTSTNAEVTVQLFGGNPVGPWADCGYVDRYGATASSRGTNIDPGGVADTYALVEITAATLRPIRWLVLCAQNADTAFAAATQWTVRLKIGASTEAQIGGDLILTAGATTDNARPFTHWYFPIYIPKGSRLSVDAKCSSTTDDDRDLYISIFGAG